MGADEFAKSIVKSMAKRWDVSYPTALALWRDMMAEFNERIGRLEPIVLTGVGTLRTKIIKRALGRPVRFGPCQLCIAEGREKPVLATPKHIIGHGCTYLDYCAKFGRPPETPRKDRFYLITKFKLYAKVHEDLIEKEPLRSLILEEMKQHGEVDGKPSDVRQRRR